MSLVVTIQILIKISSSSPSCTYDHQTQFVLVELQMSKLTGDTLPGPNAKHQVIYSVISLTWMMHCVGGYCWTVSTQASHGLYWFIVDALCKNKHMPGMNSIFKFKQRPLFKLYETICKIECIIQQTYNKTRMENCSIPRMHIGCDVQNFILIWQEIVTLTCLKILNMFKIFSVSFFILHLLHVYPRGVSYHVLRNKCKYFSAFYWFFGSTG